MALEMVKVLVGGGYGSFHKRKYLFWVKKKSYFHWSRIRSITKKVRGKYTLSLILFSFISEVLLMVIKIF